LVEAGVLGWGVGQRRRFRLLFAAVGFLIAFATFLTQAGSVGRATSGGNPYAVPVISSTNHVLETTLTAQTATVDIGNGVLANAQTFNGTIPGPTFLLNVGDTVIVHFHNGLSVPDEIHWHGIEVPNEVDGTPFTQNTVPPNGDFTYKFIVNRPGLYWYHPHEQSSTNQVFAGLYGMIIVKDPNEAALQASGTLPPPDQTKPIVLSDTTVCKTAGTNDTNTYQDMAISPGNTPPWAGTVPANQLNMLPQQLGPTPKKLCETPTAVDQNGNVKGSSYNAGDIPSVQQNVAGRENEGQTVLTNGKNVGARAGTPSAPGPLAAGASTLDVRPGQGLRLEVLNAAAIRYFRLLLTTSTGTPIPLVRVGGEGGLLDSAVLEGSMGPLTTGFNPGEILLPPGSRADVVAAIPASASGVATLWTEDYQRTGMGYSDTPTVPVMHLNVTGAPLSPAYAISQGTPLRAAIGDLVPALGPPTGTLLDPATFSPPKPGCTAANLKCPVSQNITFTNTGGGGIPEVNGIKGDHNPPDYATAGHLDSTRYAKVGDTLELTVQSATNAHHPFHLHGFEIQPIKMTDGANTYTWPYHELLDNIDIPGGDTLTFRVKIDDRPKVDGTTAGGVYGRWLFHCHIFFHAELGMLSELVVTAPNGKERPNINVDKTQVTVNPGQTASVTGTFNDIDAGEAVTLSSSVGTMHDLGGGHYSWSFTTNGSTLSQWVYLTATNSDGLKAQMPVFLNVADLGPPTLTLPGPQTGVTGKPLSFGISANDPDAVDTVTLSATGLPAGLTFKDNGNRTGTVSGTVTAPTGVYTAGFSATDGKTTPAMGSVQITITAPPPPRELTIVIAKKLKVSRGAIAVGCLLLHPSIKSCTVTVFVGGKKVGSATASQRRRGKLSLSVKVKLDKKTLKKIANARHGVSVKIHVVVTKFDTKARLTADTQSTVVRR
jgi:FtsP/CotA-like multicopper oxidase with cupredoxin domain